MGCQYQERAFFFSLVPPLRVMPLSFFHNEFLAAFIIIMSSFELHFVPILVLHPYEPLLSPSTKADSVTFSAKQRRMSKNSDNYMNIQNNIYFRTIFNSQEERRKNEREH